MPASGYTVLKVCELALQRIGAFPVNDSAPQPGDLKRAIDWLDLAVRHLAGTEECLWLVPDTIPIPLTADTASYVLANAMGANVPDDGTQWPVTCVVRDSTGFDGDIKILRRDEYDLIDDKDESGRPESIYIDRLNRPKLYVHPVPATTGDYTLYLTVQTFNKSIEDGNSNKASGLRYTWDLWLVTRLAELLAKGPIRRLSDDEVRELSGEAEGYLMQLLNHENREHADPRRRIAAYYDF